MSFATMAKAGAALAVGIGAVKGAFALARNTASAFGDALDMGGRLSDLAARTGIAAGEILVLERAFQNSGAGAEKAGPAINKMQRAIVEAGQGVTTYQRAFDSLGISLDDLSKQDAATQFQTIAKAIAGTEDPAQRAASAMQIFGRSGAELLPLFGSMSSEINTARGQLGLMPQIMNKLAERFDGINDKIAVIRGKFVEFAAGILSTVVPAIDLVTEVLSKFDAAKFGRDLANVFVGAGNAMKGFQSSLDALKAGEGILGLRAAFLSIKAQIIDTANSVAKNFIAAFSAVRAYIAELFSPDGYLYNIGNATIQLLGAKLSAAIGKGVAGALPQIGAFKGAIEDLLAGAARNEAIADNLTTAVRNNLQFVVEDFARAGTAASKEFQDAFDRAGNLIDDTAVKAELEAVNNEIQSKIEDKKVEVDIEVKPVGELAKGIFQGMSAKGGLQLFPNLKADKINFEELMKPVVKAAEETKKAGEETKKEAQGVEVALNNGAAALSQAARELKMSEQVANQIAAAMGKAAIDPGGRLQGKLQQALGKENFAGARRLQRQIEDRERKLAVQEQFGRKSAQDIQKELGLKDSKLMKTLIGDDSWEKMWRQKEAMATLAEAKKLGIDIEKFKDKNKWDLEEEIKKVKEAQGIIEQEKKKPEMPGKPKIKQPEKPPGKPKEETLIDVVKVIKDLVQKLERKLPTPALV
jgi:hypothetical protein